jgi:hypothetical protein
MYTKEKPDEMRAAFFLMNVIASPKRTVTLGASAAAART